MAIMHVHRAPIAAVPGWRLCAFLFREHRISISLCNIPSTQTGRSRSRFAPTQTAVFRDPEPPFPGSVSGMDPGVAEHAWLPAMSLFMLGLKCPRLRGTAPEVKRESSGSPFQDAAGRHLLGCLGEEPAQGGWQRGGSSPGVPWGAERTLSPGGGGLGQREGRGGAGSFCRLVSLAGDVSGGGAC